MLKLLIADDERIIRETISKIIDWKKYDIEVIGLCKNGIEAYDMILDESPDSVLTDIRMPGMSGLDLIREVHQTDIPIQFIILSGYGEFEYAKEAIKIGISDYLLTPVTSVSLLDTLKHVADEIREEQEKSRLLERYFASYEKYTEFLDNTNYTGVDRKLILDFLKLGAMEECDPFVEEYFAAIGENNYQSLLLRQYLTMDIFYCIQEFLKGLGEGNVTISPEVTDIKRIPKVIVSVDTTKMYLKEQFQAAIEARNSVSNDRYGSVIQSAKEYIEKNFSNGELSLNRIAAHIGVSPSYFSSIFKQVTGTTFVEYLTKVRIDKACELLRCTNSRTAEIGEQVGYSDPHYFSATFKKVMGQSPKDYRAGQKG